MPTGMWIQSGADPFPVELFAKHPKSAKIHRTNIQNKKHHAPSFLNAGYSPDNINLKYIVIKMFYIKKRY